MKNIFLCTARFIANKRERGFTTSEIMTALLVLTLTMVIVLTAFYFVFQKTRTLRVDNQMWGNISFAMETISKDLAETLVSTRHDIKPPSVFADGQHDSLRFWGQKNTDDDELSGSNSFYRLSFSSLNSLPFEPTYHDAPVQIVYYLDDKTDAAGGLILRRQTNALPYPAEFKPRLSDPILVRGIQDIHFIYYDDKGNHFYDWDSDNPHNGFATPSIVELALTAGMVNKPFTLRTAVKIPCQRPPSVFIFEGETP